MIRAGLSIVGRTKLVHYAALLWVLAGHLYLCGATPCETDQASAQISSVVANGRHLQLDRSINDQGSVRIAVCSGDLRIVHSSDRLMHIEVTLKEKPDKALASYVAEHESLNGERTITLMYPERMHPLIFVRLPRIGQRRSEFILHSGEMRVADNATIGDRHIHVDAGKVTVYLNRDEDYSELFAKVDVGNIDDRRRETGSSASSSRERVLRGKGIGTMDVHVDAGSIILRTAH